MENPYPIPRQVRQTDVLRGDGGAHYGPFSFRVFDIEDVELWLRPAGARAFSRGGVTVSKVSGLPLDHFTITANLPIGTDTDFVVRSARLPERSAGVVKGTRIDSTALEKELSKLVSSQQELRRDISGAVRIGFDAAPVFLSSALQDGDTLMKSGDQLVAGPSVADLVSAEAYADEAHGWWEQTAQERAGAEAARAAAEAARDAAEEIADFEPELYELKTEAAATFRRRDDSYSAAEVDSLLAQLEAPIGSYIIMSSDDTIVPPGYLLANGAAVTSAYPQLRAHGLAAGWKRDGAGNPLLPDTGGKFMRFWVPGQIVDSARVFGADQEDAIQNIEGIVGGPVDLMPSGAFARTGINQSSWSRGGGSGSAIAYETDFDASRVVRTANETRPVNITGTMWVKAYSVSAAALDPGIVDLAALTGDVSALSVRTVRLESEAYMMRRFACAPQVPAAGALLTWNHTLGRRPDFWNIFITFSVAQQNYIVGEEVPISLHYDSARVSTIVACDETTFSIRCTNATSFIALGNKLTGAVFVPVHNQIAVGATLYG